MVKMVGGGAWKRESSVTLVWVGVWEEQGDLRNVDIRGGARAREGNAWVRGQSLGQGYNPGGGGACVVYQVPAITLLPIVLQL